MVISNLSDATSSIRCTAVIYEWVRTNFRTGISTAVRCRRRSLEVLTSVQSIESLITSDFSDFSDFSDSSESFGSSW